MDATSSAISGGITFSPMTVGSGTNFGTAGGGLHFDIPLAAVQAFSNQALSFTAMTAHMDQGFLGGVIDRATASVDAASQRSAGLNLTALNAGWGIGVGNIGLADKISARASQTAQYGIQQTSYQTQVQQKQSTVRKIFSRLTGGIFG